MAGKPEKAHWIYWYFRGASYERLGKWPEAEADYLKALELDPDQPSVLNELGFNWVDRNLKLKEGLALLEKAVKLQPDNGDMLDSLGWAHYRLGDYHEAIKLIERAAALEPKSSEIRNHLGDAYWRTGRQDEARKSWEQALSLKPDPADAEGIRGKIARGLEK
ncbi:MULTISPECIES: tetratricopeptide repeat protein [unclassified Bradyrhizobium]|uniref:tetratricopeptide repeat protein n=1 Tax=unclassified Bradyrhizobium TaxID=2631580 RepID=UPI002FF2D74C